MHRTGVISSVNHTHRSGSHGRDHTGKTAGETASGLDGANDSVVGVGECVIPVNRYGRGKPKERCPAVAQVARIEIRKAEAVQNSYRRAAIRRGNLHSIG